MESCKSVLIVAKCNVNGAKLKEIEEKKEGINSSKV